MLTRALIALAVLSPSLAHAAEWEIDGAHTAALFKVRHMMVSDVRGEFGKASGTVNWDGKTGSIEVVIDATSINTRNEKRDGHLRSPDFFDVAKFPTIAFKSKKIVVEGKDKLKVTGDLTMHGVTREVTLDVAGPSAEMKDPGGNTKIGATATGKINRLDYGLKWNVPLGGGGVLVGEEVAIEIDVELQKKGPATAPKK